MTFTPQGGMVTWDDEKLNTLYGSLITLPEKNEIPEGWKSKREFDNKKKL